MVQANISASRQIAGGAIDDIQNQPRPQSQQEHQRDRHEQKDDLSECEVGQVRPFFIQRPVEDALQNCEDENRRDQQADYGKARGPGRERESSFEYQELANKTVQPRQTQRREQCDTHKSAENGRDFAQAAEVIQTAQAATSLLDEAYKPKQRRGGQPVIEHLQHHAIDGGGFFNGNVGRIFSAFFFLFSAKRDKISYAFALFLDRIGI